MVSKHKKTMFIPLVLLYNCCMDRDEEIKTIIENLKPEHRATLESYFAESGSEVGLNKHFYKPLKQAGQHVTDKTRKTEVTPAEIYMKLGAKKKVLFDTKTEASHKQELTDLVVGNVKEGKKPLRGIRRTTAYETAFSAASRDKKINAPEYLRELGFGYDTRLDWDQFKSREDVYEYVRMKFDEIFRKPQADGKMQAGVINIDSEMLKENELYSVIRTARSALGDAVEESIGEFINSKIKGYDYGGYNTMHNIPPRYLLECVKSKEKDEI